MNEEKKTGGGTGPKEVRKGRRATDVPPREEDLAQVKGGLAPAVVAPRPIVDDDDPLIP